MIRNLLLVIFIFSFNILFAQNSDLSFISYGVIPTWTGVAVDWNTSPKIHIYDSKIYKGHSEFVARGLGRKIRFDEFKKLTKEYKVREFLPFFLYDLKDKPYKTKQGNVNWAVRLENYNYNDNPEHLAKEIVKLKEMVSIIDNSFTTNGLIILTEGEKDPLSVKNLGKWLDKSSESYIKFSQFIKYIDGKKISILNPGLSYGLLKLVKNDKELEKLLPTDIAVLDYMPMYIPPVAGIISLKPITPLSHINLLAKNRGTFNAYVTNISVIPNLKKLIGKYVKFYNKDDSILLEKITKKVAEENKLIFVKTRMNVPEIKIDSPDLIELTKENEKYITTSYIGAKAANYYLLSKILPDMTRPAYAIGFKNYLETIKGETEIQIQNFLNNKDKLSKTERKKLLEKIQTNIMNSNSIPPNCISEIQKIIAKYPSKSKIRIRSSTNNEDLPEFNGAGLYESKGFNTNDTVEKLKLKILSVYASLWSEKAFLEREYFGIDHSKIGMALLIHEAFQKEVANGVIVTSFNKDGKIQIIVNAQVGEHSVTNPEESKVSESFIMNPEAGIIDKIYTESSLSPVFINNKANELQFKKLQETTITLHSHLTKERLEAGDKNRYGIDIEFKIMHEKGKNKLYFKQVRLLKY
ncbi:MAG: hypothetical protein IPL26_09095 [Leptospiraceae bacterium]|nr:hypothetical protein [Leptospiraceae bacterium]